MRIGAILGLGVAYAGSQQEKVYLVFPHRLLEIPLLLLYIDIISEFQLKVLFLHLLSDSKTLLADLVFSAISLGLVFVGTCNEEIAQSIISVLRSCTEADISKPIARMLPLALGLLYLGKQASPRLHIFHNPYCNII